MKRLSDEEVLSLTKSNSIEEFMIKKDLLRNGPFNAHDSYDLVSIFCAQHKEKLAWEIFDKKALTINAWFYKKNKNEKHRQ